MPYPLCFLDRHDTPDAMYRNETLSLSCTEIGSLGRKIISYQFIKNFFQS